MVRFEVATLITRIIITSTSHSDPEIKADIRRYRLANEMTPTNTAQTTVNVRKTRGYMGARARCFPFLSGYLERRLLCGTKEFDGAESGARLAAKKRERERQASES